MNSDSAKQKVKGFRSLSTKWSPSASMLGLMMTNSAATIIRMSTGYSVEMIPGHYHYVR